MRPFTSFGRREISGWFPELCRACANPGVEARELHTLVDGSRQLEKVTEKAWAHLATTLP